MLQRPAGRTEPRQVQVALCAQDRADKRGPLCAQDRADERAPGAGLTGAGVSLKHRWAGGTGGGGVVEANSINKTVRFFLSLMK